MGSSPFAGLTEVFTTLSAGSTALLLATGCWTTVEGGALMLISLLVHESTQREAKGKSVASADRTQALCL